MKIVCDAHIPYLVEAVKCGWPEVEILPMKPEEIDTSVVHDADVLVVRTRTKVAGLLLEGSRVRLVCTATIGFDHIDTAYCESRGIRWVSCPGCNAQAVCDYIEEALNEIEWDKVLCTKEATIGIVGVGHVGSLVARMAERKGMRVLLNDPPKGIGETLDFIGENSDIITFHTPLTKDGRHPTYHLCGESFLSKCKPGALIINAARGGVVDEQALLRSGHPFILDTWENEPDIHPEVVQKAYRASMHIAGYSVQGKKNASQACLDAISQEFCLPILKCDKFLVPLQPISGDNAPGWLGRITDQLKKAPQEFEQLRKQYKLR